MTNNSSPKDHRNPSNKVPAVGSSPWVSSERPVRDYVTGPVTMWVRRIAVAITSVTVLATLIRYPSMPDTIPTHFNAVGEADGWGSKTSIFVILAIAAALTGGCAWLSARPQIFNYPKVVTEANAQDMYRAGEQMMVWMMGGMSLLFAGLLLGTAFNINTAGLALPGGILVGAATIVGLVRLIRL